MTQGNFLKLILLLLFAFEGAHALPCTFYFGTNPKICAHILPDQKHFKEISVDVTKPGSKIYYYFWKEKTPGTCLSQSDLKNLGYDATIQLGMYYMFVRGSGSQGSACSVRGFVNGDWTSSNDGSYVLARIAGQAGIYYTSIRLRKVSNPKIEIGMVRSNNNDEETKSLKAFVESWDEKDDVSVDFLPLEDTHYFGVPVPESQRTSVKLEMIK